MLFYLLNVGNIEVKRACCVQDCLEWRIGYHGLVKSTLLGNVWHNSKRQLPLLDLALVRLFDLVGLLLRSYSCHDGVAPLQQNIECMGSNEAASAGEKNTRHF